MGYCAEKLDAKSLKKKKKKLKMSERKEVEGKETTVFKINGS